MKKDQVRQKILQSVLNFEVTKGHLKWRVADIARVTNVRRALIYYHFGQSKEEILNNSLMAMAEDYFALDSKRSKMVQEGRIAESLTMTRQILLKNPSLAVLYQRGRTTPSPLRDKFMEIEARYQEKIRKALPSLSEAEAVFLHALFHGILTAPFITDKAFKEGALFLETLIVKKKFKLD